MHSLLVSSRSSVSADRYVTKQWNTLGTRRQYKRAEQFNNKHVSSQNMTGVSMATPGCDITLIHIGTRCICIDLFGLNKFLFAVRWGNLGLWEKYAQISACNCNKWLHILNTCTADEGSAGSALNPTKCQNYIKRALDIRTRARFVYGLLIIHWLI